jgi:hypothetical protein
MPMREALASRASIENELGLRAEAKGVHLTLLGGPDFVAVSIFSAIGILLWLCAAAVYASLGQDTALLSEFPLQH